MVMPNPWYYEMPEIGFNYRASGIHCALGLSQLDKLERFVAKRRALVERYAERLARLAPLVRPIDRIADCEAAWHLCPVLIDFEAAGTDPARGDARARGGGYRQSGPLLPPSIASPITGSAMATWTCPAPTPITHASCRYPCSRRWSLSTSTALSTRSGLHYSINRGYKSHFGGVGCNRRPSGFALTLSLKYPSRGKIRPISTVVPKIHRERRIDQLTQTTGRLWSLQFRRNTIKSQAGGPMTQVRKQLPRD